MFIDTEAANRRSRQPRAVATTRHGGQSAASQTPFLDEPLGSHDDAPPTYLEATTPGLYYGRSSDDEGATLLNRDNQGHKEYAFSRQSFKQSWRTKWTRWLGMLLLIIFVFASGVAFTTSARKGKQASVIPISQPSAQSAATGVSASPTLAQPAPPDESEGLIAPDIVAVPWPSQSAVTATSSAPPQLKQTFPIRWPARCGKKYKVKTKEYDFGSPQQVTIRESLHQLDGPYKRIQGWMHITKAPADQALGTIQVRLSYAVSPSINVDSVKHVATSSSLIVGDPSTALGFGGVPAGAACLGMSIVLYMAPGATLQRLYVEAAHLGMQIHGGADFSVTNQTLISLTSGTLDASMLNSRETYLQTTSGSISGKYALSDLLVIDTKTGSVNIDVAPKAVTDGAMAAIFRANSHSGSMRVDFERKRVPERDYQMFINTTVGSVDGTFIHGSKTEINSVAGSVAADILPFRSGAYPSELKTSTHSGQMNVTLRAPYKAEGVPMTGLTSIHKSVSGGVALNYPKEWQGHIDGTSLSGELHLQGRKLELLSENDTPGKNYVEAKKGPGGSKMVFDTVSGGCDIQIGQK